jgi:hypothetical protein
MEPATSSSGSWQSQSGHSCRVTGKFGGGTTGVGRSLSRIWQVVANCSTFIFSAIRETTDCSAHTSNRTMGLLRRFLIHSRRQQRGATQSVGGSRLRSSTSAVTMSTFDTSYHNAFNGWRAGSFLSASLVILLNSEWNFTAGSPSSRCLTYSCSRSDVSGTHCG